MFFINTGSDLLICGGLGEFNSPRKKKHQDFGAFVNNKLKKFVAVLSLLALCFAWAAGVMRGQSSLESQIKNIVPETASFELIDTNLYEIRTEQKGKYYISFATHPGYAGAMQIAIVVNTEGIIETVALIKSPDTKPYIKQILDAKLPDAYLGQSIQSNEAPDAVSGATMSSVALTSAIEKASTRLITNAKVLAENPNFQILNQESATINTNATETNAKTSTAPQNAKQSNSLQIGSFELSYTELFKCALVFLFFGFALFLSSKTFPWNKKRARYILLASSLILLGFLYSTQFSFSTVAMFVSGMWLVGLASYAPLICLILAIIIFIYSKKNIYCAHICPFGALQEGISLITNCSGPKVDPILTWISRFFALSLLCFALYFSSPASASYEPFGKTFNMVGSLTLFMLSSAIILASLFIKKPWCKLLCPISPFFDYIQFWRSWIFKRKTEVNTSDDSL